MYWFYLISDICPDWLSHTAQPSHWLTRILPIPLLFQYLPSVLPGSDIKLDMTTEYFITVEQGQARDGDDDDDDDNEMIMIVLMMMEMMVMMMMVMMNM